MCRSNRQKEITRSLKTDDHRKAQPKADALTTLWTNRFEQVRKKSNSRNEEVSFNAPHAPTAKVEAEAFREELLERMNKNLPSIFDNSDEDELKELSIHCRGQMEELRNPAPHRSLTLEVIGLVGPWVPRKNRRTDRLCRQAGIEVLQIVREEIDVELNDDFSEQDDATTLDDFRKKQPAQKKVCAPKPNPPITNPVEEHNIIAVLELMLSAKKRVK